MTPAIRPRAAFSLLELVIAIALLGGVMAIVTQSLAGGTQLRDSIADSASAGNKAHRATQGVANDLRFADVNKIYLDGTGNSTWFTADGSADWYSFKTRPVFAATASGAVSSMDALVTFSRGVVLKFAPNGDGTGTLTKYTYQLNADGSQGTLLETRTLATDLAWQYRPLPNAALQRGFAITQLDPNQATVVGNRLEMRCAAFKGQAPTGTADGAWRPIQESITAIYLRASMFDNFGEMAPAITSASTATGNVNIAFIYDIRAINYPTSYSAAGLPPGLTCNSLNGRISGTPTAAGTYTCQVLAQNDVGSDTRTVSISIAGERPVITSALALNLLRGQTMSPYQITATASPTAFGASGLPAGLSFSTASGVISGSPTASAITQATISASNANGTGSASLTITVTDAALPPPVITSSLTALASQGQPFSYTIQASNNPSSFAATSLPSGLSLNTTTGVISGTVSTLGTYHITILATNSSGSGSGSLVLTVQPPVPIITSALASAASVGTAFTYKIVATNSPTSYAINPLPTGGTFNTLTGELTFTPTAAGAMSLNLAAINSSGAGYAVLTLSISALPPPTVTSAGTASAMLGRSFSYTITASDNPTSFGATNLPEGIALTSTTTGIISGTPRTTGSFTATITATNGVGTGEKPLVITVAANPDAPTVAIGQNSGTSPNFQSLGTMSKNGSSNLVETTFAVVECSHPWSFGSDAPAAGEIKIRRGWVTAEKGSGSSALKAGEFLIVGTSLAGLVHIKCSVSDGAGNTGFGTRDF